MTIDQFSQQIQKTGFVLENQIAQLLKAAKWTVISNRYYVDDTEETIREIDLVAYQVSRIQHFDVYTALLISCKKSEANAWALLSRKINLKDPNSDWQPLHTWSNDKALAHRLARHDAPAEYHKAVETHGVSDALRMPDVEVFAFQEMSKTSGAPQNDKAIFSATTSLMKAQAYERDALVHRKRTPAVYQFNLLSVVDSDLVRLYFESDRIEASPVEHEHYIARYIIKKQATVARIRFLRADKFSKQLPEYAELHRANCKWFDAECDAFYSGVVKDSKRTDILISEFRNEIKWDFRWATIQLKQQPIDIEKLYIYWREKNQELKICAPVGDVAESLNKNEELRGKIAAALLKIFRYSGKFEIEDDDIPF